MPRIVDHEERRREIVRAVERLVGAEGLDGVTVAAAAAEAEMSVGSVQHYFASKDEMLLESFRQVRGRVQDRVTEMRARSERVGGRIEQMLVDGLSELLPLDANRRRECAVTLAFTARAWDNADLAGLLRAGHRDLHKQVAQGLRNAFGCGELPEPIEYDREAYRLLALVDGLVLHWRADRRAMPARTTRSVLADEAARLLPGRCRHHD